MTHLTLEDILNELLTEDIDVDSVRDAIENKYYVRIKYDDQDPTNMVPRSKESRVIEPVAVGTTKKGNPVVRAFQINGNSRRGAPKWKFFRLDRVTSWRPMRNKKFYEIPDERFGKYNTNGDRSMMNFYMNADFGDMEDSLNVARAKRMHIANAPKISTRNVQGPIGASQQWNKNVFTSFPKSKKYAQYAKNVSDTSRDEIDRMDADLWDLASKEAEQQNSDMMLNSVPRPNNSNSGAIANKNSNDDYDEYEVDYDEDDFLNNNRSNMF